MDSITSPNGSPATADSLLASARRLFTEHGYDGASVRAITAAAGTNLGAVTYHFGSKQALYERVVDACIRPLAEGVVRAATVDVPPMERVGAVVRAYFDYLWKNPDVPHLIFHAMAAGKPPQVAVTLIRGVHAALVDVVRAGQQDGSMRPGNPMQMAIGIVSHPLHLMLLRGQLRAFLNWNLEDSATRERVILEAIDFARGGLSAAGPNRESER